MTGSGESLLVTARSAPVMTAVIAVPVLLPGVGSTVALAAVALLVMVEPLATLAATWTTMVKVAISLSVVVPLEKTTLPVAPTAGALVLQPVPEFTTAETKVVPVGRPSVTVTVCAALGPLLTKLIV